MLASYYSILYRISCARQVCGLRRADGSSHKATAQRSPQFLVPPLWKSYKPTYQALENNNFSTWAFQLAHTSRWVAGWAHCCQNSKDACGASDELHWKLLLQEICSSLRGVNKPLGLWNCASWQIGNICFLEHRRGMTFVSVIAPWMCWWKMNWNWTCLPFTQIIPPTPSLRFS